MNKIDYLITHYELVQEPGRAGYEKILRANEEVSRAYRQPAKDDDLHPAWIVFGFVLIAAEYFWLFSVTA